MITQKRRKAGVVIVIVGVIVFGFSFVIGNANSPIRDLVEFIPVVQLSGVTIALLGVLTIVAPKDPMERKLEKIDQLEKRIAQLERNQKNTP